MASRHGIGLRAFAAKLRGFLRLRGGRRDDEHAFDAEIQDHLRLLADRYATQGMSRAEAVAAARRQFGNITMLREDRRELQTLPSIESCWQDLRYALRVLWKDRSFAAVSIVTLGLGIGAATAIFSVVYNILLAPFPYAGAERVVFPRIYNAQLGEGAGRQGYKPAEILEFAENNHVFDGIAVTTGEAVRYDRGDGTEVLIGALVTPGSFEFFGMPALLGRVVLPSDYDPAAPPVFVLRHKTWMERFSGDAAILRADAGACENAAWRDRRIDVERRSAVQRRHQQDRGGGRGTDRGAADAVSTRQRGLLPGAAGDVQEGTIVQRGGSRSCASGRGGERDVRPEVSAGRRSDRTPRAARRARRTVGPGAQRWVRDRRRRVRRGEQPRPARADRAGSVDAVHDRRSGAAGADGSDVASAPDDHERRAAGGLDHRSQGRPPGPGRPVGRAPQRAALFRPEIQLPPHDAVRLHRLDPGGGGRLRRAGVCDDAEDA